MKSLITSRTAPSIGQEGFEPALIENPLKKIVRQRNFLGFTSKNAPSETCERGDIRRMSGQDF